MRRDSNEFAGDDFTRPTGPAGATTFLGRAAWTIELAPPARKPHPMQLVVDADTGVILQQRNDAYGSVDEWVEFVVGEPLDSHLFRWDGPTRSAQDQRAVRDAEHEADGQRRRRWFADNVTARPLRVELDVPVWWVHEYDDDTGAFQASLGTDPTGLLARRPTSPEPWELGWSEVGYRWSSRGWDWAVTFHSARLTDAGLQALKEQLDND